MGKIIQKKDEGNGKLRGLGKRASTHNNLKAYFMIFNMVLAIVAFSGMLGAQDSEARAGGDDIVPGLTPSTTPTAATSRFTQQATSSEGTDVAQKQKAKGDAGSGESNTRTTDNGGRRGVAGGGAGGGIFGNFLNNEVLGNAIYWGGAGAGLFGTIGALAGGDDGAQWGAVAGAVGGAVVAFAQGAGLDQTTSLVMGLVAAGLIFAFTYSEASTEITEFYCLPWQAPIGGGDCEICNDFEECSEYTCRSLGQACQIVNEGTQEQRCVWQNPSDVNSPIIEFTEVSRDHTFRPDKSIRPPATGVIIKPESDECVRAFFPLAFSFETNEPAQCKIDYNLTVGYEEMNFFLNGSNLYTYNHSEKLSLPGPEALNAENPELKNNGEYTLFVRCQDANGNFNQDAFSVNFCVEPGPDTTPPIIAEVNIPSGNPVRFNQSDFDLEVYVNEPSECSWSRTDQSYENMEQIMDCDTRIFQMNNKNLYTCRTTLTGIQDRKENEYFFRCKDQPTEEEGDRNVNTQSYNYVLLGTQPLNILEVLPNETIRGAADVLPVELMIMTDNGHDNGNSLCYYYNDVDNSPPLSEEDYVLFHETKSSTHVQRQDLTEGTYTYYFKCVDLGGNADYDSTNFRVETDRSSPEVIRVYKDTELKIITDEKAECTFSNNDCNFEIESGIAMSSFDNYIHTSEWQLNKNYYIRCKDRHDNQPFPNSCSIVVRPSQTEAVGSNDGFLDFGF
jgi:hypothetical protein